MPTKRTPVTRYSNPGLDKGQLAFLAGDWDMAVADVGTIMEFNHLCWLTEIWAPPREKCRGDSSPGPLELWRKYGKEALHEWRKTHPPDELHPAEEWLGPPE
jgi:hypothetical protein